MIRRSLLVLIVFFIIHSAAEAKSPDPYKVLGVEKNATQREIQKAFHKLSLRYHPDKNKNKGAQEKFAEINNAYELLSDEERRKNYDLFGDDKTSSEFNAGDPHDHEHDHFTGGQGNTRFSFRPGEWQHMGGGGHSKSYSFSFGNPNGESSFGFDLSDIFSNVFGGDVEGNGGPFGAFSGSHGSRSDFRVPPANLPSVNSRIFKKEISDQGLTWLILSYIPTLQNIHYYESIIAEATKSLQGALKTGGINCGKEHSFCNDMGIYPRRVPRLFLYSYKQSGSGSLLEYNSDLKAKNLKEFCISSLPRLSKRVGIDRVESLRGNAPRLVLMSTKKDTPVIWRALSGLHHKRFSFYDTLVDDVLNPVVKRLGVKELPAVVGWLSNGEKHVLKTGIRVKDLESGIRDLSALLDGFERLNKAAESGEGTGGKIRVLTASNFDAVCGETIPVCVIGVFRSSTGKAKLESVLTTVSQKSLSRGRLHSSSRDSVCYALLDASKHPGFLNAFQKCASKSLDKFLLAYKPKRRKFAAFTNELTVEEAEKFVASVLNGDVHFTETSRSPSFV